MHQNRFGETANADTGMTLYGTRSLSAPSITALSSSTLPRAGRLIIVGSGFGDEQAGGTVQIEGAIAPVSHWSETSITAYVSDAAPLGSDNVQVVTAGGASNSVALTVTARPPQSATSSGVSRPMTSIFNPGPQLVRSMAPFMPRALTDISTP